MAAQERPLVLRLDNGTQISFNLKKGTTDVTKFDEEGLPKAKVSDVDVERLGQILQTLESKCISRKRKMEEAQAPANTAAPPSNGHKKPKNSHKISSQWRPKCADIIGRLRAKKSSALFRQPVDRKLVPDYDLYIKNPMDLTTLARNLNTGKYPSPAEFAADMELIWHNCAIYNKPTDPVAHLGVEMSREWQTLWARSGLDVVERADSLSQDLGPSWFPDVSPVMAPAEPPSGGPHSRNQRMSATQAPLKWGAAVQGEPQSGPGPAWGDEHAASPPPASRPPQNGLTTSKESKAPPAPAHAGRGRMTSERMALLAGALEGLDDEGMQGVVEIVMSAGTGGAEENDEFELNLDEQPDEVLWLLDDHAKRTSGGRYDPDASQQWH